jgi:hypothetical protein
VRTHTTARLEFDRDTYTPCTSEELPSLALKEAMIADRSDLVAGRADEPVASAVAGGMAANTTRASVAGEGERNVTPVDPNGHRTVVPADERNLIASASECSRPSGPCGRR